MQRIPVKPQETRAKDCRKNAFHNVTKTRSSTKTRSLFEGLLLGRRRPSKREKTVHSVDVEHRHTNFLVVNSTTFCKVDCPVKSISTFIAPRGSSPSKQFTVLIVMIAIAGFLGTTRWYSVKDASPLEASLSYFGFASLLLVTGFELDVVPERFLDDKLIVTGWLIEKLKLPQRLPFKLHPDNEGFRDFIRNSKEIYHLYEEDKYILNRAKRYTLFHYNSFWSSLHMLGACCYIICVTSAIIINDMAVISIKIVMSLLKKKGMIRIPS